MGLKQVLEDDWVCFAFRDNTAEKLDVAFLDHGVSQGFAQEYEAEYAGEEDQEPQEDSLATMTVFFLMKTSRQ